MFISVLYGLRKITLRDVFFQIGVGFESFSTSFTAKRSHIFMSVQNVLFQRIFGHENFSTSFTRRRFSLPFSFSFHRHFFVGVRMLKSIVTGQSRFLAKSFPTFVTNIRFLLLMN